MFRVAEQWSASDLGRQRQGNEDSFFVRVPLFVVADGMGGAQAGEVASELAVRAFRSGLPDGGAPAEKLVEVIQAANARIHEMSRRESRHAGMGTTCTAAYVTDGEVVVAHVGDSRCYLLRDGDLVRLTRDHSLVGELVARGKLTEEQAEQHPQRSVITRALGPEPRVQVDVDVFAAKDEDVFLLCSDGLTSMVAEPQVAALLGGAGSLEQAGRALIRAANEAGGRDNITVVLFRLEDVGDRAAALSDATTAGHVAADERSATVERPTVDAEVTAEHAAVATAQAVHERESPELDGVGDAHPPADEPRRPWGRRRWRRRAKILGITLLVLSPLLLGAWAATRSVFFVGVDPRDGRSVAIFRGLPYDLPGGIELYTRHYTSGVSIDTVPDERRATFTDHKLRSLEDAEDLVTALERGQVE